MNRLWLGKGNPAAPASSEVDAHGCPTRTKLHGNLYTYQPASSLTCKSTIDFNLRKEMSEVEGRWEKYLFKCSFAARLHVPWRWLG